MEVGKAVFDILFNDSDVRSLISESGSNPRIFPSRSDFQKISYLLQHF